MLNFKLKQTSEQVQKAIDNALYPDKELTKEGVPADSKSVGVEIKKNSIHIGTEAPTNGETVWIDTDEEPEEENDGTQIDVIAQPGQIIAVKEVDANGKPTKWEAIDLPKAKEPETPDFSANEGDAGYIENRTHYVDKKGVIHKLPNMYIDAEWMATSESYGGGIEWTLDLKFTGAYGFLNPHWFPDVGIDWDVYWNGVKYSCSLITELGEAFIGNRRLLGEKFPDTGEPFLFTGYALANKDPELVSIKKNTSTNETVSIMVTQHAYTVYNKLPKEFLPDNNSGSGGGADIDVTAEVGQTIIVKEVDANGKPTKWESADYQPRTHYTAEVDIYPENTIVFDDDNLVILGTFTFNVGDTYKVTWGGEMFECVAVDMSAYVPGAVGIGNLMNMGFEDTGEPFTIASGETFGGTLCTTIDGEPITVTIKIAGDVDFPIPAKYIPSDVRPFYVNIMEDENGVYVTLNTQAELQEALNANRHIMAKVTRMNRQIHIGHILSATDDVETVIFMTYVDTLSFIYLTATDGYYEVIIGSGD